MGGATQTANPSRPRDAYEQATPLRSLVLADCGTAFTKVALIGRVEDHFRLLAQVQEPTTTKPPDDDLALGILRACARLERITGRVLIRAGRLQLPEDDEGAGFDALALAVTAGGPLRLLTGGPAREALAGLLYRSLGGLFVQLESLAETREDLDQERLAQLGALNPHGVLVLAGHFAGGRGTGTLVDTARVLPRLMSAVSSRHAFAGASADGVTRAPRNATPPPGARVPVIVSGSTDDAAYVADAIADAVARAEGVVLHAQPLAPASLSSLAHVVAAVYQERVLAALPGYDAIRELASAVPVSTTTALGGVVRYLAQRYQMSVVGVDVGANSTELIGATATGDFVPAGQPEAGVGPGSGATLRMAGAAAIRRWLSWTATDGELREYVQMRMLHPHFLPNTAHDLELEHALAREAIRLALHTPGSTLAGLTPTDVVIGTGGTLAHTPSPAHAALVLLDALQPQGIASLVLDSAQLATSIGAFASLAPSGAAELAEGDAVPLVLGSVISCTGRLPEGEAAVRVVLDYQDGRQHIEDVAYGALARLPLPRGARAHLSLYPAATIDVGLGAGQHARASEPIEGGVLGVVVDARGRPLLLAEGESARIAQLQRWRRSLGIDRTQE